MVNLSKFYDINPPHFQGYIRRSNVLIPWRPQRLRARTVMDHRIAGVAGPNPARGTDVVRTYRPRVKLLEHGGVLPRIHSFRQNYELEKTRALSMKNVN